MTPFETYIDRLIRLHELMALYPEEDGGDPLRDEMYDIDRPGRSLLTAEEQKWVHHLSGDLYMIHGQDMYRMVPDREIESRRKLLSDQIKNKEWLNVLYTVQDSLGLP